MSAEASGEDGVVPYIPDTGDWPCQFDPHTLPPGRLTAALYRIMRDHLPTGVIEQILIDVRDASHDEVEYTNLHLRDLAFSHAGYLTEGFIPRPPSGTVVS